MLLSMESDLDLPAPIDDSLPPFKRPEQQQQQRHHQELEEEQQYYYPPQQMYIPPPHHQQSQETDLFASLERTHWIIFIAAVILAFFMGKSISTPIIIRSS
jgi:hypothetical protein